MEQKYNIPSEDSPRLLPIIIGNKTNLYTRYNRDRSKCIFLLKALRVTQDPKQLASLMGVKKVAEVYRTLDKLALRKEYHGALAKLGIDFEYILRGFKDVIDAPLAKDADRVSALKALLKSVGMDEYKENVDQASGGWEEVLGQKIEDMKELNERVVIGKDYEVIVPTMPSSAKMLTTSENHG